VKQKPPKIAKKLLKQRAQKLRTRQNFQKSPKIAKLEGTINTPSEGTNNYARNKTSKNPQKTAKLEGTINTPPSKTQQNDKTRTYERVC
jgi:hypothetical protein